MNLLFLLLFLNLTVFLNAQYVTPQYAEIRAVSAMCSSDGITASIDFDKPFTGKIYSLNYEGVNDCLYYNNIDRDTVLFSIPAHICGTQLQRTTRNLIDQMENRVYVQMDKDTQTSADKQFSFVCRLTDPEKKLASSPAKDDSSFTKDSYQSPPIRPVASSISTKMSSSLLPIKPSEVRQVAAFSRDSHLGNWPIPGSKPYEPSMQPVSTYPLAPISPQFVSSPTTTPTPFIAKSPTEGYVTRPISNVGPLFPQPPPPQPMPTINPLFPGLFFPPTPAPPIHRSPPLAHLFTTTSTIPPPLPFPIVPNVHFKQGVGVPFSQGEMHPTKVDASQWNDPNAYATAPPSYSSPNPSKRIGDISSNTIHVDVTTPRSDHSTTRTTQKTYKEEPPTADAPFSSDNLSSNHVIDTTKFPPSITRQPTTSVLKTTQDQSIEPEVTLEIQRGEGPFAPPVTTPIKIGDNISLVVKAKSYLNDSNEYDMFVHSCFATNGKGDTKVQIIDENGCVIRREFASPLHRAKDEEQMMFYYVMIKAFKFPGPDDVYFSCTIEFTPSNKAPNICSKLRRRREILPEGGSEMRLFDSVNVELENEDEHIGKSDSLFHSSSLEECESEKYIYIGVVLILFLTVVVSLISNVYQFIRAQRKS